MDAFPKRAACSTAVARNREPILAVLMRVLPAHGLVLEIASGTGEHAVHFAAGLPHLDWQPTDRDADARQTLPPGGVFYLYGPFKEDGRHTAPSNADFDAGLRARNPDWGVRDLGDVSDLARAQGLDLVERISMPANNLSLIFRSRGS
jgi:hypothetical protein